MPVTTCSICQRSFTRADNLRRHRLIHERAPIVPVVPQNITTNCHLCGRILLTTSLDSHMQSFHVPWTAPICEDIQNVKNPTNMHKPKQCPECGLFFLYDVPFKLHLHQHELSTAHIKAILNVSISYNFSKFKKNYYFILI